MEFNELLMQVLYIVLTGLAGIAVNALRTKLKREGILEWIDAKERIVDKSVMLVAALYEDLNGEQFKNAAYEKAAKRLKESGINISKSEIDDLVNETIMEIMAVWQEHESE